MQSNARQLTEAESKILTLLGKVYFDVVPLEFRTYCALTAAVSRAALARLGLEAELLPCQMWYVLPGKNFVVGFTGARDGEPKWDGHVICAAGDWFVDAAVHHFRADFRLDVPPVIVGRRFLVPAQAIARVDLSATTMLWWHRPPPEVDSAIPVEPRELIEMYSSMLAERIGADLGR